MKYIITILLILSAPVAAWDESDKGYSQYEFADSFGASTGSARQRHRGEWSYYDRTGAPTGSSRRSDDGSRVYLYDEMGVPKGSAKGHVD